MAWASRSRRATSRLHPCYNLQLINTSPLSPILVFFHIRARRHIRPVLTDDTARTIVASLVGSRLDYGLWLENGMMLPATLMD